MRQPQTETIKWMPYPENKPAKMGNYYVTFLVGVNGLLEKNTDVAFYDWNYCGQDVIGERWIFSNSNIIVIAYAELPKGYK